MKIFIIHDNKEWIRELVSELESRKIEYYEWYFNGNTSFLINNVDFNLEPPVGIFFNRISASSHTRNGRYSIEYCKCILQWLKRHNRIVINGLNTIDIEISKVNQYLLLGKCNILFPRYYMATNKNQVRQVAENRFSNNFIMKDNRSGSGHSVKRIENIGVLEDYLENEYTEPIDGVKILQEYIKPVKGYIIRLEFINYKLVYALQVMVSDGEYNLCPAGSCSLGDKFNIIKAFGEHNYLLLVKKLKQFCKINCINICGIEFIEDSNGNLYVFDINCNTNYNRFAEKKADIPNYALGKLVDYLEEN
jgi:hypothetical protein